MPIILYALMALGFLLVVTTDGPIFCIHKNKTKELSIAIGHIYKTESPEDYARIALKIENESSKGNDTKSVTLKEAFVTDPKYVRCQWVNVWNIIFHELAGVNVIYIYSNTLLR